MNTSEGAKTMSEDSKEQAVDNQKPSKELSPEDLKQVVGGAGAQASGWKVTPGVTINNVKTIDKTSPALDGNVKH
jgi:hypothetical protein